MTALLGFAIGLFLAAFIVGCRHWRQRALDDVAPPEWVNGGSVVIPISQLEDEINFAIWELEMGDR